MAGETWVGKTQTVNAAMKRKKAVGAVFSEMVLLVGETRAECIKFHFSLSSRRYKADNQNSTRM